MKSDTLFTIIDLGRSKVRLSVIDKNKKIYYSNFSYILSNNFINDYKFKIKNIIIEAEKKLSLHLENIILLLDPIHIKTISLSLKKILDQPQSLEDILRLVYKESEHIINSNYDNLKIIHIEPSNFILDNKSFTKKPKGDLKINSITTDLKFICFNLTSINQITNIFTEYNLKILEIFCTSFLKSKNYIELYENKKNVTFLDIGFDRTTISIYNNNIIKYINSIPIGGNNITKDISKIFNIELVEAEKIKRSFNNSNTEFNYKNDKNESVIIKNLISKKISIDKLKQVILYRVQEIIDLSFANASNFINVNNTDLILTGEGSKILNKNSFYLNDKYSFNSIDFFNETDSQICTLGLINYLIKVENYEKTVKKKGIFEKFFNLFGN